VKDSQTPPERQKNDEYVPKRSMTIKPWDVEIMKSLGRVHTNDI
jgi:hypothetical protein